MNLKGVYEIFYPKKNECRILVWKTKPKYRTKQEFFETLIPMEMRWLSPKLWNDKARRSRFFSDSKTENRYLSLLKEAILQNSLLITRLEGRCGQMLEENICGAHMNRIFFQIVEEEQIELSAGLKNHLMDEKTGGLKSEWGNVLAFLILYAIFPMDVNQLYGSYLYEKEVKPSALVEEPVPRDGYLFQSEYPPDMSVHRPGDMITHTWILKNVGEVPWEDRYLQCSMAPFPLSEENMRVSLPKIVYPGDTISPTVRFQTPDKPGAYELNWKVVDKNGNLIFRDKVGVGLHFTVLGRSDEGILQKERLEKNNYRVLNEIPEIPATLEAGKIYTHAWTIQNTGTVVWKDYYCECINCESFHYTRNEMRIPMKRRIAPGEQISVMAEFVTPPTEGVYCFVWQIKDSSGMPAFSKERRLEILLNLI